MADDRPGYRWLAPQWIPLAVFAGSGAAAVLGWLGTFVAVALTKPNMGHGDFLELASQVGYYFFIVAQVTSLLVAAAIAGYGVVSRAVSPIPAVAVLAASALILAGAWIHSRSPLPRELLSIKISLLESVYPDTREQYARELGALGPKARAALPALQKAFREEKNRKVRKAMGEAIRRIGGASAVPRLDEPGKAGEEPGRGRGGPASPEGGDAAAGAVDAAKDDAPP